jgi:hypothetical protein
MTATRRRTFWARPCEVISAWRQSDLRGHPLPPLAVNGSRTGALLRTVPINPQLKVRGVEQLEQVEAVEVNTLLRRSMVEAW